MFGPDDIGAPTQRNRRYSLGYWLPFAQPTPLLGNFRDRFCCTVGCDARVYLEADPSMQDRKQQSSGYHPEGLGNLSSCEAGRVESYMAKAHSMGWCSAEFRDWQVPFALADITQNANFRAASTKCMPALLRKTKLWELVSDQAVGEVAMWLAQGVRHPQAVGVPPDLVSTSPFGNLLSQEASQTTKRRKKSSLAADAQELSAKVRASLVGNSMHVCQDGTWFCHAMTSFKNSGQ